ncbi:MAG: phosphoglucosamine mutase [Kiritimatiellia bacterium]
MGRLFGTDGVRGVANQSPMTAEMVLEIGRAAAYTIKKHDHRRHCILIGKDTRVSGYMLENALTAGICSMGVDVLLVGPMPTPGIAFITRSMRADAGLMISASHNPYQDNGIKIFAHNGHKLPDAEESEIEELITSGRIKDIRPTAGEIGKARRIDDAAGRYVVFCKNTFPEEVSLEGMKIVLDCANGATYKIAPTIFTELGAEVVTIHDKPNGTNINLHCGSQHTQDLKYKVLETKAHAGLAFDGDGDRVIVVDDQGNELTGDHVLAICGKDLKDRGKLVNNLVVTTVMANFGLYKALKQLGIDYVASQVGDRYVLEAMKQKGAVIGGEASGHTIFLDHHSTGDGIISALQLLSVVQRSGEPLSSLASVMQMTPQRLVNIDVKSKPPLEDVAAVQEAIKQAEAELKDDGRVLIRYSGTQSMCRVMVEGPTEEMTDRLVAQLADVVKASIG